VIADLASDDKPLFVELDGLARLAQIGVGEAQVAETLTFTTSITNLASITSHCS